MKFVHLHTHSHYSLLDGLPKIDELVARAKELGMDALALTDHGNLYGAVEFYKKARAAGIKPILGVETYLAPNGHQEKTGEKYYHLTLLAKSIRGWKNLLILVTRANLHGFYYKPRIDKQLLKEYGEGLIALSGCVNGELSRLLLSGKTEEAERAAKQYLDIFGPGNFYIEITHHPGVPETIEARERLTKLAASLNIPLVATQDIHYLKPEDAEYHDILLAVQTGNKLNDSDRLTLKADDFSMRGPEEMASYFKECPEAIQNTIAIAEQCNVELELGKIQLPKFQVPENLTSNQYLERLTEERITRRYPSATPEIRERVRYELSVIEKTGFADYFLIVQDFINWAKERNIVVGPGRGSAAGSIISYILGITEVNPIKYNLLFERFLNPDRIQMPDIDVDVTDVRRDEVVGYLREKYGEDHVANIITFGTMAARAGVRDVGRALGISYSFCDQLAKLIPFSQSIEQALQSTKELRDFYENNPDAKKILDGARHLEGVARHASVHACGIVITNEPLVHFLPLQRAPQDPNVIVSQFEMHSVENLGLLKMDLLGLRNLTIIENTVRLVRDLHGEKIDIASLPLDDKNTFTLLQRGNTIGVFQMESSGMTRYLKELKPNEFEDLIAMVALYRPGPLETGQVDLYIARKHKKKPVTYLHPKLEPILKNTYGIMIYQEQLMNAARELAGFTLAEADILRKAVGKKIKSLLQEQKEKLIQGCLKNGVDRDVAEAFWALIEPFERYGFNRSHGACYALIAYQTAYLKAHYPIEFMTSLLNAESGDVERIAFLVSEAKKMGIEVFPPDINKSASEFTPEGTHIRFGLTAIKNLGSNVVAAIIEERERGGPFSDLSLFLSRIQHKDLNKKSLESLIKCGALDSFGVERKKALENIDELLKFSSLAKRQHKESQSGLFGASFIGAALKLKDASPATPQEKLAWEKELLGLYVSDHPLNRLRGKMTAMQVSSLKDVRAGLAPARTRIAGVISELRRIVTKNGDPMLFAKIEDLSDSVEVVVFPETLARSQNVWQENKTVILVAKTSTRNGEFKMICDEAVEL